MRKWRKVEKTRLCDVDKQDVDERKEFIKTYDDS